MLQTEFEERIGKTVGAGEYEFIERIYMACPTVDKDVFCKEYKKNKLGESFVVTDLADRVNRLEVEKQQWQHTAEQEKQAKELLKLDYDDLVKAYKSLQEERDQLQAEREKLAVALIRTYSLQEAEEIIGKDEVIALKCANDIFLNAEDKAYLADRLKRK